MNRPAYLINLDGSDGRLHAATEQLNGAGIRFERVAAFDGRNRDPSLIEGYDEAAAKGFTGRKLSGGELGCFFSHKDCARRFLDTDAKHGLVFEDDIRIVPQAKEMIDDILTWLDVQEQNWDLINIGPAKLKITTELKKIDGGNHGLTLVRAHYFPVRTSGLIWSRRGAETFLADPRPIFAPVDNYFRDWLTRSDTGLSVWPPIVTQDENEVSEITGSGGARKDLGRTKSYGWTKQKRMMAERLRAVRHKIF